MGNFTFSKRSIERMKGVNPELVAVFLEAIKYSPVDFGIPQYGGLRTKEEQNGLFAKNVSNCDGINNISNHQRGQALDFYAFVNGKSSWNKVHLSMVASCILSTAKRMKKEGKISIELTWGGAFGSDNFNGWDMPHIEVKS